MYLTVGSVLALLANAVVLVIVYLVASGIYRSVLEESLFADLFDLQCHNQIIGSMRMVLFPLIPLISIAINYLIATELYFSTFPTVAWLVGPFHAILGLVILGIIFASLSS